MVLRGQSRPVLLTGCCGGDFAHVSDHTHISKCPLQTVHLLEDTPRIQALHISSDERSSAFETDVPLITAPTQAVQFDAFESAGRQNKGTRPPPVLSDAGPSRHYIRASFSSQPHCNGSCRCCSAGFNLFMTNLCIQTFVIGPSSSSVLAALRPARPATAACA